MKHGTWNLFCLFSLLVFVSSVTIWVRSYFVGDSIEWIGSQTGATEGNAATHQTIDEVEMRGGTFRIYRKIWELRGDSGRRAHLVYSTHRRAVSPANLIVANPPGARFHLQVGPFQLAYGIEPEELTLKRNFTLSLNTVPFPGYKPSTVPIRPKWVYPTKITYWIVALPLWLFLPAGVPPFLWWRKRRKKGGRGFPVTVASADKSRDREVREDAKTAAKG